MYPFFHRVGVRALFVAVALISSVAQSLAAEEATRWWKGNLHTHSLWSDGDDYPEMICEWYKSQGYNFLALSDHNIIADHERWINIAKSKGGEIAFSKYLARFGKPWVEERETEEGAKEVRLKMLREFRPLFDESNRFLLIQSEEISDRFLTAPIHINITNVQELVKPQGGRNIVEVMQNDVNAVLEQRARTGVPMFPHINHPNFGWGITAEELGQVQNERFFEVYNGHPSVHNEGDKYHASIDQMWDIVLTQRIERGQPPLYGLANDDSHDYHGGPNPMKQSRPGRGWVMVRAANLSPESIIAAMEAGDFYATSGIRLKDVRRENGTLSLEIDAEPGVTYRTEFIGTRKDYDRTSEPVLGKEGETMRVTRRYSKDVGEVLAVVEGTVASYKLQGDELYVRARVTSSKVKAEPYREGEVEQAWTQPITE